MQFMVPPCRAAGPVHWGPAGPFTLLNTFAAWEMFALATCCSGQDTPVVLDPAAPVGCVAFTRVESAGSCL